MLASDNTITIDDVARLAGVSRATAGRVVGNYGSVSEKTRRRVMEAVKQLDYQPNFIARGLRSNETKTIAVIVGSIKNNYSSALIAVIEREAQKKGYDILICNSHEDVKQELQHLKNLTSRKVDGIILMSAYKVDEVIPEKVQHLYVGKLPLVFVDRTVKGIDRDVVQSENFGASYEATKYLINMGHRKIGVISTDNFSTVKERLKGYRAAYIESGIPVDEAVIARVTTKGESSREVTRKLLNEHPDITALYILNNSLSSGVLLELKDSRIKIPDDISLLAWDDEEYNELLDITTVEQPIDEIGRMVVQRLFELMGEPDAEPGYECMKLKTKLIIRKSCTPPSRRK